MIIKNLFDNISTFFTDIFNKITHENEWRLYMYLKGQLVAKRYIKYDAQPFNEFYVINVYGKKHLVGTNLKVTMIVKPTKLKYTDNAKKSVHVEIEEFGGVDV